MELRKKDKLFALHTSLNQFVSFVMTPVKWIHNMNARWIIASLLGSYLILGFTVLGFNRTPFQAFVTTSSACLFDVFLSRIFKKRWIFPLSAMITSFSLSILLNYSHNFFVLFIPVFFAIGFKYILTFNDRHVFNPAQSAVSFSLLFASSLITSSPAYQWNGIAHMGAFIAGFGLFLLAPSVKRLPLVSSFLFFFTLQILFRSWLMKHHLPFETLFLGTITSPAFFLFTFFMITDPATSPPNPKHQILVGFSLAFLDLIFHIKQSYHTFFFAGFTLQSSRLIYLHLKAIKEKGSFYRYFIEKFYLSGYYKRPLLLGLILLSALQFYQKVLSPKMEINHVAFKFQSIDPESTSINPNFGDVLLRVDPRTQHMAKWLLSVGDAVAVGDYDEDGLVDLFFTFPLKDDENRNSLYKNLGDFKFERISLPMISEKTKNVKDYGLPTNAMFVDYDNDKDLDLFITYAFGSPILLENQLIETGFAEFKDVTKDRGLDLYTNSISANFFDFNRDGSLDLIIGNVWPKYLPDYPNNSPQKLNLFKLPEPQYEGDIRMFNFIHESWHMADNGGVNDLLIQDPKTKKFILKDSTKIGLPEHYWTLAIGTGDLNQDGWIDLYVANDFGPDQLYYNRSGKSFEKIEGKMFGSIGKDTYKGMNATLADIDNNGMLDVYVSNVHHELQAEGSLLWMFSPGLDSFYPNIEDQATKRNALNEDRFGWGASVADFDNNGFLDIAQANGMVDDSIDKKYEECPDFWYVNEKIARSGPEIHKYVHNWGDIRGYCIYGKEKNRLYLNTGSNVNTFVDVADKVGMTEETNSRGMSSVDLNNDGMLDLIVTHQFSSPTIYENKINKEKSSWIGFKLTADAITCNSNALGSKLELTYQTQDGEFKKQFRELQLVSGFTAQNDMRAHFGLGNLKTDSIVSLKVDWCQKKITEFKNLRFNQYHELKM
jgi:Na+-translocating ferredoxin:NAD+ oxidoreductase RnfD subunit